MYPITYCALEESRPNFLMVSGGYVWCKRLHVGGQNRGLNVLIGLYVDDSQPNVHMTGFLQVEWVPIGRCYG